jgi:hypothetical protein
VFHCVLYSPQGRPLSRAGALSEIRETNCELFDRCFFRRINLGSSVVDPHHINADPDPDPSFQIKAQTLGKVLKIGSYSIHFGLSSAN